jgi:2-keto-4-pentenoate hydratase/2-oxohepta-3-ene-1,7-dioic acid hydratase in catechol pathway
MKLTRFGKENQEKPAIINDEGQRFDVSAFGEDYNEQFFATDGPKRLKTWVESQGELPLVPEGTRFAPATCRPSKIICVGLNFKDHAEEGGMEVPKEPVIFFKSTSSFVGPNDNLIIPKNSEKTDWEVELAVVIGKKASYVSEENALDHVAGYALHNDYSEREWQLERCGQWVKGKSADTYAPFGPFVATPEEISDLDNLKMWLKVNGQTKQDGNTSNLIFKVPFIIHYLSQFMTLLPGDIISTGTPAGVGLGFKPAQYIKPGDVIELGIEGLGSSSQTAVAFS